MCPTCLVSSVYSVSWLDFISIRWKTRLDSALPFCTPYVLMSPSAFKWLLGFTKGLISQCDWMSNISCVSCHNLTCLLMSDISFMFCALSVWGFGRMSPTWEGGSLVEAKYTLCLTCILLVYRMSPHSSYALPVFGLSIASPLTRLVPIARLNQALLGWAGTGW